MVSAPKLLFCPYFPGCECPEAVILPRFSQFCEYLEAVILSRFSQCSECPEAVIFSSFSRYCECPKAVIHCPLYPNAPTGTPRTTRSPAAPLPWPFDKENIPRAISSPIFFQQAPRSMLVIPRQKFLLEHDFQAGLLLRRTPFHENGGIWAGVTLYQLQQSSTYTWSSTAEENLLCDP